MNDSTTSQPNKRHCQYCGKPLSPLQTQYCSRSCFRSFLNRQNGQVALQSYLDNPNFCLHCGQPILPAEGEILYNVKIKRFCNTSCAARHANRSRKRVSKIVLCKNCGVEIEITTRTKSGNLSHKNLCVNCKREVGGVIFDKTLAELFSKRKNWQSARSGIRHNAASVYFGSGRPAVCAVCGYSNHIQVSHIVAVSEFPKTATVRQVNDLSNLIALCPNHHWEFDHGILDLSPYLRKLD